MVSLEAIHHVVAAELCEYTVCTIVFLCTAYMRIRGSIGRHSDPERTGIFLYCRISTWPYSEAALMRVCLTSNTTRASSSTPKLTPITASNTTTPPRP